MNKHLFDREGLCDTCRDTKNLDMMVRKNYKKGLYECIDCKTDKDLYQYIDSPFEINANNFSESKVKKLIVWCFG